MWRRASTRGAAPVSYAVQPAGSATVDQNSAQRTDYWTVFGVVVIVLNLMVSVHHAADHKWDRALEMLMPAAFLVCLLLFSPNMALWHRAPRWARGVALAIAWPIAVVNLGMDWLAYPD